MAPLLVAARLTTAGVVVFAAIPGLLGLLYLYLFWCLWAGRIGSGTRAWTWVRRADEPRSFWVRWWWSFAVLTMMAATLLGGLAHVWWTHLR